MRATIFHDAKEHLRAACKKANPGTALEFGVYSGTSLSVIAENFDGVVIGLDSFEGLPERWRTGYEKGHFATETIPVVAGAEVVVGLFQDTLDGVLSRLEQPVTFVHFDADIYSSTAYALERVTNHIAKTCVFVFDEFDGYPTWREHEFKAFAEWLNINPTKKATLIGSVMNNQPKTFLIEEEPFETNRDHLRGVGHFDPVKHRQRRDRYLSET